MEHSTKEFVLADNWVEQFATACIAHGSLFRRTERGTVYNSYDDVISALLKSSGSPPQSILKQSLSPIQINESSIRRYIDQANRNVGMHFKHKHGYRDHPLLVISKDYPWASFFSPISNARSFFQRQISTLLHKKSLIPLDVLVAAIAILLIVSHPFIDCNGRTARLVLFAMLTHSVKLPTDVAAYYANLFSGTNGSFVLSLWEIREENDFRSIATLLA